MRGPAAVAIGALLLAGCGAPRPVTLPAPQPADWRTFEIPGCGARLDLPGSPTHESEQLAGDDVYRKGDYYAVGLGVGYGFVVSCLREPGATLRTKSPDAILDETARERATPGVQPLERRAIAAGACPGREERSRLELRRVTLAVTSRRYVAKDRAFVLLATTPDEPGGRALASRFLDSFHGAGCDVAR